MPEEFALQGEDIDRKKRLLGRDIRGKAEDEDMFGGDADRLIDVLIGRDFLGELAGHAAGPALGLGEFLELALRDSPFPWR